MICSTINDEVNRASVLIIVIERENLDRMKQADPITLASIKEGGKILQRVEFPDHLSIILAYEDDDAALYKLARANDLIGLLAYVRRGIKFDPEVDGQKNIVDFQG